MKRISETKDYLKNIFPDKDNTYELLEYNMRADLEALIDKYAEMFAQLHVEALAIHEDYLYNDYALNKDTLPLQAMARIAYFFQANIPNGVECGPNHKLRFLAGLVDESNTHRQLNGEDIWKYLVEMGQKLDEVKTLMGFLNNDISCALSAKKKRKSEE